MCECASVPGKCLRDSFLNLPRGVALGMKDRRQLIFDYRHVPIVFG